MGLKVAALICGRLDDDRFPGRNTFPLIGRPMMVYPILAARHAKYVDQVFVTTDAPSIARVARHQGVGIIERPPELSGPIVALEAILTHGYGSIRKAVGEELEALIVLLCNAPTVTGGLIDQGIEMLLSNPRLDGVMSVSLHNEFHPSYAMQLGNQGCLIPHPEVMKSATGLLDAYFPDALLWVLRPESFFGRAVDHVLPSRIVNCATQRIAPLIHEGYGDVDYVWQVPAIETWLRRQGFSEEKTPYDQAEARPAVETGSASVLARSPASSDRARVLITTIPFGEADRRPLDLLAEAGMDYVINPTGRKLREGELADLVGDVDALIAGTEPITARVLEKASRLRLISRVGIGLDSVDLVAARRRNIQVAYTPDAPAPAVAELTIGLILSCLRRIPNADRNIRNGIWHRFMGRRLEELAVGVVGVGRVGKRVIHHLAGFGPRILANDLAPDLDFGAKYDVEWADKEQLYREADIITLHLPLTPLTQHLITARELRTMKPQALLINTSRGNMIDERDLADALQNNRLSGAAIDVFQQEPYSGPLANLETCLLTCHMGSMSQDCRLRMEVEATEEVLRFIRGEPLRQPVPEYEYEMRISGGIAR
jgi:D-3-phosphoglycerate dehydrogenase